MVAAAPTVLWAAVQAEKQWCDCLCADLRWLVIDSPEQWPRGIGEAWPEWHHPIADSTTWFNKQLARRLPKDFSDFKETEMQALLLWALFKRAQAMRPAAKETQRAWSCSADHADHAKRYSAPTGPWERGCSRRAEGELRTGRWSKEVFVVPPFGNRDGMSEHQRMAHAELWDALLTDALPETVEEVEAIIQNVVNKFPLHFDEFLEIVDLKADVEQPKGELVEDYWTHGAALDSSSRSSPCTVPSLPVADRCCGSGPGAPRYLPRLCKGCGRD